MINVRIQASEVQKLSPKITVIGVGGAGGNAVNNMISSGLEGCSFLVCNTDAQALEGSLCENRMQLGVHVTGGLGAGARPEIGRSAAEESLEDVMQHLDGSNMVFVTAGMGGGTGTGAAPVIAKACREAGILTVGVVTKPFHFEGSHRMKQAESGIREMQEYVDTLIVIPNQNLFRVANEKTTFAEAFRMADSVLQSGVRGVTDLMVMPGLINLDFADIRSAMMEMGKAMMGTGEAEGDRRAVEAAEAAISNPLLDDVSMKGARGVIINVTGGSDMTLFEVDEACNRIRDEVDPNANIIFGSTFDDKLEGKMRVSVVATGIDVAQVQSQKSGSGGVKVTAVGKQAPAQPQAQEKPQIERARPQATGAAYAAAMPPSLRAPIPPRPMAQAPVQQQVQVRPAEEPETDMFEQQEFVPAPQNTALRGTVYEGQFIPPRPLVPEPQDSAAYGHAQSQSGYVLRPPVPGASAAERRKTPSLFERITTGVGFRREEEQQGESAPASAPQPQQGGFHGALRARTGAPAQGSLNIDSPAAPPRQRQSEDELDIPAFLRRQAN